MQLFCIIYNKIDIYDTIKHEYYRTAKIYHTIGLYT